MNSAIAFAAVARDLRPTKNEIRDYLRSLPAKEIKSLISDVTEPGDDPRAAYETSWVVWRIDSGATDWAVARDEVEAIKIACRAWVELGEVEEDFAEPDSVERLPPGKSLTLGLIDGQGPGITATAAAWASVFLGPQWLGGSEY